MISVVTWKWKPAAGYRSKFGPENVNTLAAMVARYYRKPHRFICVTDEPAGIDSRIEVVPLWEQFSELKNPSGPANPSCYRRLRMFSKDAEDFFGPRFVSLDLDCVIAGDLSPLWDRPEDFVAWSDTNPRTHYNGSMMLLKAGTRTPIWDEFDPRTSPNAAKRAGHFGSDQAWISYRLGSGEATWGTRDGVYSYRNHLRGANSLPANARVVMFHGQIDPWSPQAQRLPWVRKFYRGELPDVAVLDAEAMVVWLTDGSKVPITELIGAEGQPVKDISKALAFVAGAGNRWYSGALDRRKKVALQ